ncbi:MAG: BON domain-containing protein [Candidatus Binatia bacterium]|nr:BON domain-containing protein [Candidatus Binatia bacterium]
MSRAEAVVKAVRAALVHEPRINLHRYPVRVAFSNGDLVLEGEVEHIVAKKLALELAAAVPGVDGIVDRLRVRPAQPMGDGAIRDHVRDALIQEGVFAHCRIRVRDKGVVETCQEPATAAVGEIEVAVEDGVVTLNGQVPSLTHKRLAGVLAWWVPGSRDVINGLAVVPPEEDNDDEITDAVRLVLEKDPFVDAAQVHVRTTNAVVTLEGSVPSETAKEMAEYDAWYVFGVDRVVNALVVHG